MPEIQDSSAIGSMFDVTGWECDPDLGRPGCDSNAAVADKVSGYGR